MKRDPESFAAMSELFRDTKTRKLGPEERLVVFSDLHLGVGGRTDDFLRNAELSLAVLEWYEQAGYHLILNGDIEELLRFDLSDIMKCWNRFYAILDRFQAKGCLTKIAGNHDLELLGNNFYTYPYPVEEAMRLDFHGDTIFIFHGHQMSRQLRKHNYLVSFILKYLANPLRIRNKSVSQDSSKKFKVERRIYQFSAENRILSIIGHTHRPLFESLSNIDFLGFEIEYLCRTYDSAVETERREIETRISKLKSDLQNLLEKDNRIDQRSGLYNPGLVVPCMFNSGSVIGKHGITCIEIRDERIALMNWFDHGRSRSFIEPGNAVGNSKIVKEDRLDYVFSRIRLLGG